MKYAISAADVPDALGRYSQGTTAGRLIFSAGQVGRDAEDPDVLVDGGPVAECERICDIFEKLLEEVDCSLTDVAAITVYLTDLDYADAVDAVTEANLDNGVQLVKTFAAQTGCAPGQRSSIWSIFKLLP